MSFTFLSSDVNECSSFPCQNGGTCTDGVNGYTCQCALGYSGLNCQTSKNIRHVWCVDLTNSG